MNKIVKKFIFESPSFLFFSTISVICISLTIWAQCRIIKTAEIYAEKLDTLYSTATNDTSHISTIFPVDSINLILNTQSKVKNKEARVLNYCFAEIDDYVQRKLTYSNDIYMSYITDVKKLLDNQYLRIRQEYEALQTWCAILTIVFLIFSFYSLYKTDDMVRQGRKALGEIEVIKKEGRVNIEKIKTDGEQSVKDIKTEMDSQLAGMMSRIEVVDGKINVASQRIDTELSRLQTEVDGKITSAKEAYEEEVSQIISDVKKQLEQSNANIDATKEILKSIQGYSAISKFEEQ